MLNELETPTKTDRLVRHDIFLPRHLGSTPSEIEEMLKVVGASSLDALADETIPDSIRMDGPLDLGPPRTEEGALRDLRAIAQENQVLRSYIGCGYYNTYTPAVIQRNILENPGWYTQYTPYQAEISQGRLEAMLNFQTMVCDLTGFDLANSSLLDEATAAAEAMAVCRNASRAKTARFFVANDCHPQTKAVVETRAEPLGIEVVFGDIETADLKEGDGFFGCLLQYPATDGSMTNPKAVIDRAHDAGALVVVATDLLALTLIQSPGELGADVAVGSAQRFGVPLGFGGPHAAFIATKDEYKRQLPGRIAGLSKDAHGRDALRLALQTREQHIRRAKATSNICTAQVLLAIMASMYAVYHGPDGLKKIATRVHNMARTFARGLERLGYGIRTTNFFDTVVVELGTVSGDALMESLEQRGYNVRPMDGNVVAVSLDETTRPADLAQLFAAFALGQEVSFRADEIAEELEGDYGFADEFVRSSDYLTHEVFHRYHAEHEMLRYLHRLQAKDLSLTTSMIPLGSCTMKLNATSEMVALSWPEFGAIHPFAPTAQTRGYQKMFHQLEAMLAEITGFEATSLQPNAGAQGEYTGLLVIRAYHHSRGDDHRDVCLIPDSAHGTNPASAVMAGFKVVAIKCDSHGNIDLGDLRAKAEKHADALAGLMITYPSTHGVFEKTIRDVCTIVHDHGGQVYLDGANMNAQVGLCRPGDFGADVCHLNLHKTFCIPHGGGGPGMGPICVAKHLAPFLPDHPVTRVVDKDGNHGDERIGPVSAAPYGSPSILTISWMYIAMMGAEGLKQASQLAILNANYLAKRLEGPYKILYKGAGGRVAHEFILDVRNFKTSADVGVDDIAKRLIDYGYHAPTMSWPVAGTLMVEPTESESKHELDRFCEAMLQIRREIEAVETGQADKQDNVLHNAPHTSQDVASDSWPHPYRRDEAAFPVPYLRDHKFWPPVSRVDNAFGDRNLVCTCPPMDAYGSDS